MKEEYISEVLKNVKNKKAKAQIKAELEDHIDEKIQSYLDRGYSQSEAQKLAVKEMGKAEDVGIPLNALHKGYKNLFTILGGIVVLLLLFLSFYFNARFAYASNLSLHHAHFIKFDFLSLGIFAAYIILLVLARKFNNKAIVLFIIISFSIQIIFSVVSFVIETSSTVMMDTRMVGYRLVNIFVIFQPAAYALISLVSKGFGGYIDSIFGYDWLSSATANIWVFQTASFILAAVIIIWAVLLYISLVKKERMTLKKPRKRIFATIEKAAAVFLVLNIIFMSSCTIAAYPQLDVKCQKILDERVDIINHVVSADFNKTADEQIEAFSSYGYDLQKDEDYYSNAANLDTYSYYQTTNYLEISKGKNDEKINRIIYSLTLFDSIYIKDFLCDADDYKILQTLKPGTDLKDVINSGILQKAVGIDYSKKESKYDSGKYMYIGFQFDNTVETLNIDKKLNYQDDKGYKTILKNYQKTNLRTLTLENGKVVSNDSLEDY